MKGVFHLVCTSQPVYLLLQAETLEDLYEWKAALENALSQAPSTAHANGILKNDKIEPKDGSSETCMLFSSSCL